MHKFSKVDLQVGQVIKCEKCDYACNLNIKLKKHEEKQHSGEEFKCNSCGYSALSMTSLWKHMIEDHAGGYKSTEKENHPSPVVFQQMVAEQNIEIMKEIINLKRTVKEILTQFSFDSEEQMTEIKDSAASQNIQTANALHILTKEIIEIKEHVKTPVSTSSCSDTSSVNSSPTRTSSEASKATAPTAPSLSVKDKKNAGVKKTPYQARPKVLYVGESLAQRTDFRRMEIRTKTTIKTAKGYGSVWEADARNKNENMTDVTKHELEKDSFEELVLAAPTADITRLNIETDMKVLKEKVRHSCLNIMNIAENAIADHKTLKNITILDHTPRFDSKNVDPKGVKQNLAMFANSYMRELWIDSPHNKSIHVGSHTMDAPANNRNAWYMSMSRPKEDHNTCPQAMYMNREKRLYSDVVASSKPVKTSNRFTPLSQMSGNW